MTDSSQNQFAWGISVGSMNWSAHGVCANGDRKPLVKNSRYGFSPASVLIGLAPGEPLRLDCWMPPHPRGTASDWPLEAIVDREVGSGRFPLAAAWTGRHYDLPWQWKPDTEYRQLNSLDAICFGASQLAKLQARKAPTAIVIPNDFTQREQQKLLDACNTAGVNVSLIWLPVAAALAWLEDHRETLPVVEPLSSQQPIIHVVHADWGKVRCSTLNLVRREEFGNRWIPARRRHKDSDWERPGFGWNSVGGCCRADASEVWRRLFVDGDIETPLRSNPDSTLLQQIAKWSIAQYSSLEVDNELANHISKSPNATAMIFVGDFAEKISSGPKVAKHCDGSVLVMDGCCGEDFLAYGASIFAANQRNGITSYLDTLPNLELFVDRSTHYEWLPLLGDCDQFVSGGQQWELPQPIEGLAVRRGASSIKLVVAHDEYPGVRELQITLDRPAEVDLGASLGVSATPAQGNARLLLTTQATNDIASRSILANWERMTKLFEKDKTTPLDKKRFEKSRPKAFPNLRPRAADPDRWAEFIRSATRLANASSLSNVSPALLGTLLESAKISKGRSAISSEGSPPDKSDQALVDSLANFLFDCIKKQGQATVNHTLIKILAYMSPAIEGLDAWINGRICSAGNIDDTTCLIAGNCIRAPEVASRFVNRLLSHIPRSNSKRLLSYQMQALGRLLSQRQNVMSKIPEHIAYKLVEECLRVFEDELACNNLWWLFEHSSLVVVYALRYRINNPSFMEPKSELAVRAKEQFELGMDKIENRLTQKYSRYGYSSYEHSRLLRLKAALQQLIDYIDKRGEGDILLLLDD